MPSPTAEALPVSLPVLVIDDDSALIRTLSDILRLHGYAPETAETGEMGLELAGRHLPVLAVVDLRLPDMDGLELIARLHRLSELTEIVVLTGNATVESAVAALRENSIDYLVKPVRVEQLLQVVSMARERWQRRQAEVALRDSEERYRTLFDSNPQPLWVYDRETLRFLAVNEAAVRHYGFSRDEFLGMRADALDPEDGQVPIGERADSRAGLPALQRHRTRAGTVIDVEVTSHDLSFASRPSRVVLAVDVTERRRAERLIEARARQQAAVAEFGKRAIGSDDIRDLFDEAVTLVAATLDLPFTGVLERKPDGESLLLSAGTGWSQGAVGRTAVPATPDTQAGYTLINREAVLVTDLQTDQRFPRSRPLLADGAMSGITVVIPGAIHPYGVLTAHDRRPRDFTRDDIHFLQAIGHVLGTTIERSRAEAAFRQSQRLEAVGRLAGGVAHDFNNMLTAITGYGEILRSGIPDDDSRRGDVDEILGAARRAAALTRQLLTLSRQQVLQPRSVNLNEVVAEMEKLLRRLIGADINVVISLDPELGMTTTDPTQIEQTILNLCVNSRDAMPDGGTLTIQTANVDLTEADAREHGVERPGRYVMLRVTDTGTGMDADTRARLFEPFFTTKGPDKGTGLGLATVYGIVKQSGGAISLDSEVGRGSTFRIFLPRSEDSSPIADAPAATRSERGTETILLAEDEESVRRLASRVLESAGYRVLLARDGEDARRVSDLYDGPIDLLVTDVVMPLMNGPQVAELILATRSTMRVLYLSGYTDHTMRRGVLDGGGNFLQKPFTPDMLTRKIREVLDG